MYIELHAVDAVGDGEDVSWRCWKDGGGEQRWEFRRLINSADYGPKIQPSEVVRSEERQWSAHFDTLGLSDDTYRASIHSVRQKRVPVTNEEDQASVSAAGLLALHLFWIEYRHKIARKHKHFAVLAAFLGHFDKQFVKDPMDSCI